MLLPDAHAIWLVSFLVVVVTRSFAAPYIPLGAIMATTWMTSSANQLTGADTFDPVVRRPHFVLYGAAAGYAVAAAVGSRVLIPVHDFAGKRVHLAGPLSLVSVGCSVYALATATGLTQVFEPFGDWSGNRAGEIVFFSVMFVVLVAVLGSVLYTSWRGIHRCPMAYRYRDSGILAMGHPPSRFAAEAAVTLTLLVSPHLIWIFTAHDPVGWPQYFGGLIAFGVEAIAWVAIWRLAQDRYDMENTYFSPVQSRVSWANFVAVTASVHLGSMLVYLITASFATTGLSTEILLIFTTVGTFVVALLTWLFLTPTFIASPPQRRNISTQSRPTTGYRGSEEERQRRITDLM